MTTYGIFLTASVLVVLMVGIALICYSSFLRDVRRNQEHQLKIVEAERDNYRGRLERLETEASRRRRTTRAEVYSAIDSERYFQEELKRCGVYSSEAKPLSEWIQLLVMYLAKADKARAQTARSRGLILDQIRKVAALAVCAMEEHGAPMCAQKVK